MIRGSVQHRCTQERPFALPLSEYEIQKAVFTHLKTRAPDGLFAFHPKNGGIHQRGRRSGINAGQGVVSGVPDIIILHAGRTFGLELKTEKGKVSPEQFETMKRMSHAGATCTVTFGLDHALAWLEDNGLLLGSAT